MAPSAASTLAVVIIVNLLSKAQPGDVFFSSTLGLLLGGALGNVLTAWQGADTEALRQHAHRLRGAAASVGCLALSSAALDLMHDSRPAVLVGGGEMELLHRLTGRSLAALAELAASPVQPQAMPVPPKPQ